VIYTQEPNIKYHGIHPFGTKLIGAVGGTKDRRKVGQCWANMRYSEQRKHVLNQLATPIFGLHIFHILNFIKQSSGHSFILHKTAHLTGLNILNTRC